MNDWRKEGFKPSGREDLQRIVTHAQSSLLPHDNAAEMCSG